MNLHLDGISALERIKLSAMLPAEIEALTGSSPMQRVQIAGRIAAILEQLGQDTPEAIPAIELSGNEFGEFPDTPEGATERRAAAWNHYLEQLIPSGGVFCQALQAKVQFNKTGAKKVISLSGDPRKVKLIAGLPEIIATGRKTSEAEPTAKAARSGVVKVFVLKANVNLEGEAIRARILVRQMADGTYGYDHSVDRSEAAQVTGGSSGALDSVVSTENGRSVLLPDEASPGRDLHHLNQMIGEEGEACNVLDSVGVEVLNLFLDDEVVAEEPVRLKNFGWDAVKLADYSFEQLEQLRHQVQAEHANPRDESGRYLEGGQPSLYLYDKKGRWKLDKLAWAVTYKQQDKRRAQEAGGEVSEAVLIDAGLLKQWGDTWKYKHSIDAGTFFTASTKADAVARATEAYWKAKPEERLTRAQRYEKANREEMESAQSMWGHLDLAALRAMFEKMGGDIASLRAAGENELRGDGRRTAAAVANQGARDTAEMRMKLGRYIEWRSAQEALPSADPAPTMPSHWKEKLLANAEPRDIVLPAEVQAQLDAQQGMFANPEMRGEASETGIQEKAKSITAANFSTENKHAAKLKSSNLHATEMRKAVDLLALSRTLVAIGTRKNAQAPDGLTQVGAPYFQAAEKYKNGAMAALVSAQGIAEFLEAMERHLAKAKRPSTASFDKHLVPSGEVKDGTPAGPADQYAAKAVGFDTFSDYARSRIDKLPLAEFLQARAQYNIVEHLEKNGRSDRNTLGSLTLHGANPEGPVALAQLRQAGVVLNNLKAHSNPFSLAPGVTLASFVAGQAAPVVDPAPTGVDPEPTPEPEPTPAYEIVEHVTKGGKGKTIRGIVRTDLSYAEAKAIDEYTFRKDGGYFIREKHLAGAAGIGNKLKDLAARRDPEDPEAEMRRLEAAAQAHADRLADEQLRQQQKITQQVTKLRDVAASTLERAEAEIGRDRLANTRRRASMAASGIANAEASRAIALTMNNLADAIERGQAQHLAGITSRADVQTLSDSLRGGRYAYEKANNISHMESERRKHDPYTRDEAFYATFPVAKWDSAGASRARILEMIKGKRGAPAIANEIRYSSEMTREQILALRNILGQKELESQLGWWNVEQLARGERLRRAGITNTMQLREALGEFIDFKAGARQEDPIAKAERAIIGQKVGIDFFPTPKGESKTMATLARIEEGDDVLEPSAGNGNLADAAKAAGANVDVIEISSQLRDILTAKGYTVVAHDFSSFTPTKQYDAILMNPPFSNRQDADHIMRAFTMLKPGGRLVAIAGEGVFFGRDAKATAFREWLDENGAEVEALAGGTFKDTSLLATTGANARRIVVTR